MNVKKVAIIGAGNVGAASAQRICEADLADVVLVDVVPGKAEGLALDLSSVASIVRHSRYVSGTTDYKHIAGADIVVLTAGFARQPGQSRAELLKKNSKIVKDLASQIARLCPGSIIIVVTNPLDVITYLVRKTTGFPVNQVIGMGGVSDCARFNMLVAAELNTDSHYVQSIIIGPHSDQMVILPRLSTVLGTSINELLPADRVQRILSETRSFGAKIVQLLKTGSAFYGPSAGVFLLVDSIVNDRKNICCACAYLDGQYGLNNLCLGVPVKIGRMGIEEIIELKLNQQEAQAFLKAAKSVQKLIKQSGV